MISVPQALREFVFSGRESSISLTQMRFGPVGRDWIVIRDLADGSQVQLAVTAPVNLMDAWQALAGTGAALMLQMTPRNMSISSHRKTRSSFERAVGH